MASDPTPTVEIAGHRCERGSEAHRLLNMARAWRDVHSAAAITRKVNEAKRAPGYLGPASEGGGRD